MGVYAAFLEQRDHEVGRLLQTIKAEGHNEDTMVLYIVGDNGTSGEGGLDGHDGFTRDGKPQSIEQRLKHVDDLGGELFFNHYAAARGWATNTSFQWTKQVASHLGGTRDPLIVSWPGHIKGAGGFRTQFHHVTDIAPTIYELAGVQRPDSVNGVRQLPLEGKSLVYTFDHPDADSPHVVQYFEMLRNRGIYDGWWAGSRHLLPWEIDFEKWEKRDPAQNPWELYELNSDYSQAHDLAAPTPGGDAKTFVYHAGVVRIPAASAPALGGSAHRITGEINIPDGTAEGVILALGGHYGGFSLYIKNRHVRYEVNAFGSTAGKIVSSQPLPAGSVKIVLDFTPDPKEGPKRPSFSGLFVGPGVARLSINSRPAGETQIAGSSTAFSQYEETLDVGSDLGTPVSSEYVSPFSFTGAIERVTVDLL
jgi:arylsulfatase